MDEKTPHLHLTFVPLTKDNRLCAKEIKMCIRDRLDGVRSKKLPVFQRDTMPFALNHHAMIYAVDEMGVKKLPKVKELQTEYAKLLEEKKKTYAEYRRSREEMRELLTAKANVDRVLKMEVEQDVEKEKDHGQR